MADFTKGGNLEVSKVLPWLLKDNLVVSEANLMGKRGVGVNPPPTRGGGRLWFLPSREGRIA